MTDAETLRSEIKPYRSYKRGADKIILEIDKRIPLAPNTEITPYAVAELFKKHKLSVRRQSVIDVANALIIINATVPIDQSFPSQLVSRSNAVASAIEALSENLPILNGLNLVKNDFDKYALKIMMDLQASANKAQTFVAKLRQRHPSTFWHDDAQYLHWCMAGAILSNGVSASFTNASAPAVKFIRDAFLLARLWHPRFDREWAPTCPAIAEAIDKRKKAAAG